jgi:hypothetical protein
MTRLLSPGAVCRSAFCSAIAALFALALVSPTTAQALRMDGIEENPQPQSTTYSFAYGTHVFRRMLFDQGLRPLTDFEQLHKNAPDAILVVLGKTGCLHRTNLPEGLTQFLDQGGAVLVATDQRPSSSQARLMLAFAAGVEVANAHFVGPDDPDVLYRGKPFCPILESVQGSEPDLFRGPRLEPSARLRVATNTPACLQAAKLYLPDDREIHKLAWLPAYSVAEGQKGRGRYQTITLFPPRLGGELFAVGGTHGEGRLLVLADHSIFINQMMLPDDTGNVEFTYNCLEWLREGKRRHQVLLVEDDKIRTDLDVPLKQTELPPGAERVVAAYIDDTIARMEQQNTFNRKVWDWLLGHANGSSERIARWVVYVLTLLVVAYALYRLVLRGRHRFETTVPLLAHAAAGHTPAASLLEQRFHAALRDGNLWETAHHLARQWFATLEPLAKTGPRPPRVAAHGGWWRRRRLRRTFDRLWRLAHTVVPAPVRPRLFRRLLRELVELKAAFADGTLRLQG